MRKHRILIIESNPELSSILKTYFEARDFDVLTATRGAEALETCRLALPNVVLLDVHLPDTNGYELCQVLRQDTRIRYAPIIFLSPHNRRDDILRAFQVGADDYVLQPFDIEELYLRVNTAIRHSRHGSLLHPVTNLPGGELITEHLRSVKDSPAPWVLLYFHLENYGVFKAVSEPEAAARVLVDMADILQDTVERYGAANDFVGHASDDAFVVITAPETAGIICDTVRTRFKPENLTVGQATGLLKLTINGVSSFKGPFTDIREIGQMLAASHASDRFVPFEDWTGPQPQAGDVDYFRQLSIQAWLWRASPQLAQALEDSGQLVTTRLPEFVKIDTLLRQHEDAPLAPEVLNRLLNHWQTIHWAEENLAELSPAIRRYQKFEPSPVLRTLRQVAGAPGLPPVQVEVAGADDVDVSLPVLKLQQLFFNLGRWAETIGGEAVVVRGLQSADEAVELQLEVTAGGAVPAVEWDWPATAQALLDGQVEAVYRLLALKIAARYGAEITFRQNRLAVLLPQSPLPPGAAAPETLWRQIRELRHLLAEQRRLHGGQSAFSVTLQLVDMLADDLLNAIETMHSFLVRSPEIDLQVYPWKALQQQLRYSRLLALELCHNRPLIPAPVNLRSLLESIEPLVLHRMLGHKIVIECDLPRPVINSDKTRLAQVFFNLTLNALEAMPEGGVVRFTIRQEDVFIVEVSDTGRGIPPEHIPHLFEPTFSTKGPDRGVGLYHVKTYLYQLKGQIEV
ncbi:MAG: response regulator, partial [Chloroflexi bacterium]